MARMTINEKIILYTTAIDTALSHPEIGEDLAKFKYDTDRLSEGKMLLTTVQELHLDQKNGYGNQFNATDDFKVIWSEVDDEYRQHVKMARVALKKRRGAQRKLALEGARKRNLPGWLDQTMTFYHHGLKNEDIKTALDEVGLTEAMLTANRARILDVIEADKFQEQEKHEARRLTNARNKALAALERWISDFKAIAQVALADKPHLLKLLGFSPA